LVTCQNAIAKGPAVTSKSSNVQKTPARHHSTCQKRCILTSAANSQTRSMIAQGNSTLAATAPTNGHAPSANGAQHTTNAPSSVLPEMCDVHRACSKGRKPLRQPVQNAHNCSKHKDSRKVPICAQQPRCQRHPCSQPTPSPSDPIHAGKAQPCCTEMVPATSVCGLCCAKPCP